VENREQDKIWWEKQKNGGWKNLTDPLAKDSAIHSHFNNFIKKFYWQFRLKKGIPRGSYSPEINFQGFKEFIISEDSLGKCSFAQEKFKGVYQTNIHILINQIYLLNKLGMEKYITNEDYSYLEIHFDRLIETIAHELAHAYQYTINREKEGEMSSCESSGKKDAKGNFLYPELVTEHTQLIKEIKQMIITSSNKYQEFKNWWVNQQPFPETPEKNEEEEFEKLITFLKKSQDLLILEKNYQTVKKSPFYSEDENTLGRKENNKQLIDNYYTEKVIDLRSPKINSPNNSSWFLNGSLWTIILILWVIALLATGLFIISRSKRKKRKSFRPH